MLAVGKSEVGLYGVIGGMSVIVLFAYIIRLLRISPDAAGRAANRELCRVRDSRAYLPC